MEVALSVAMKAMRWCAARSTPSDAVYTREAQRREAVEVLVAAVMDRGGASPAWFSRRRAHGRGSRASVRAWRTNALAGLRRPSRLGRRGGIATALCGDATQRRSRNAATLSCNAFPSSILRRSSRFGFAQGHDPPGFSLADYPVL
jgi:hypothetical protein